MDLRGLRPGHSVRSPEQTVRVSISGDYQPRGDDFHFFLIHDRRAPGSRALKAFDESTDDYLTDTTRPLHLFHLFVATAFTNAISRFRALQPSLPLRSALFSHSSSNEVLQHWTPSSQPPTTRLSIPKSSLKPPLFATQDSCQILRSSPSSALFESLSYSKGGCTRGGKYNAVSAF